MAEVTENDIRRRFAEVDELMGRHETALAFLNQERVELEAAIRAFDRFRQRQDYSTDLLPPKEPTATAEGRKPAGMPSMPDMILEILREANILGSWMEPKGIAQVIRTRWWPDAPLTSVGPIAWRMAKDGRLKSEAGLYTVPENETPALAGAGASEPRPPDGGLF